MKHPIWKEFRWQLLLLASVLLVVFVASGWQGAGYIGVGSVAQQVLTNQTSPTTTSPVRNVGQSAHWLEYCTGTLTGIDIRLEASFDATTWFPITDDSRVFNSVAGKCTVLEAGGYYPNVRVNLLAISGGGAGVSAFYYGAISPITGSGAGVTALRSIKNVSTLEANSMTLFSTFTSSASVTNPAINATILALFNAAGAATAKSTYLGKATLSCSAACNVAIFTISDSGTGCATVTPANLNGLASTFGVSAATTGVFTAPCGGANPTAVTALFKEIDLAANQPFTIDLAGVIDPPLTQGIVIKAGAALGAGNMTAAVSWYEQ